MPRTQSIRPGGGARLPCPKRSNVKLYPIPEAKQATWKILRGCFIFTLGGSTGTSSWCTRQVPVPLESPTLPRSALEMGLGTSATLQSQTPFRGRPRMKQP